ncbi:MAG: DUF4157 domain-containing protein [Gammaproteobacteria bacterium]|nr:DUF4157 domain-containing protein [Gammaproteobacteria bacterium]MDH5653453.1 DUF4157 domain-containing protein [Gammaproteobacteria bacterium]
MRKTRLYKKSSPTSGSNTHSGLIQRRTPFAAPTTSAQTTDNATAGHSYSNHSFDRIPVVGPDSTARSVEPQPYSIEKEPLRYANNTGMPDRLKNGIENLSGYAMDDVRVHYNSSKPAQLQAHAYTQGTNIHIAPGQEKHLPHEAWHVVQQKQGRVKPTLQMKGNVNINDETGLEREADLMGAKLVQLGANQPEALTQRKLHEITNNSPQAKQATKFMAIAHNNSVKQQTIQNKNILAPTIQLYPQKKKDSEEYFDPDLPKLTLIKLDYNKFQIKGDNTIVYFERDEGYYTDEGLTKKADMSAYRGEREGISNANGEMYYCRDNERDGIITIKTAEDILKRFFDENPRHRQILEFKVNAILSGFKDQTPLPPIEIELINGKATLVDGRHRIHASIIHGFKYVPYSSNTI